LALTGKRETIIKLLYLTSFLVSFKMNGNPYFKILNYQDITQVNINPISKSLKMKTNVLIINEQPEDRPDVFSSYLSGRGIAIKRLSLLSALTVLTHGEEIDAKIILVVNYPIEEAVNIKKLAPQYKVMNVNGGKKSFGAVLYDVYGPHDNDPYSFGSWEEFEKPLFSFVPRPKQHLIYSHSDGFNSHYYRFNPEVTAARKVTANHQQLAYFMEAMVFLSEEYLKLLEGWAKEVTYLKFPVKFSFKNDKKIKRIIIPLINEHRGLPVFKEGDNIYLWGESGDEPKFKATVAQIEEEELLINFGRLINRHNLTDVTYICAEPKYLSTKIKRQIDKLKWFKALMNLKKKEAGKGNFKAASPIDFLADCAHQANLNEAEIPYNYLLCLNKETEKILRDQSQVKALESFLGPEFISLIIGPAGTGKTSMSAVANQQLVNQASQNVLGVSHSNLGADNITIATAKHLASEQVFRLGNKISVISPPALEYHNSSRDQEGFFNWHEEDGREDNQPRFKEKIFLKEVLDKKQGTFFSCTIDSYPLISNLKELKVRMDVVEIDEASQGLWPDLIEIFAVAKKKLVLIGDPRQLGNIPLPKEIVLCLQEQVDKLKEQRLPQDHWFKQLKLPKPVVYYFARGFFNSLIELEYLPVNLLNCNRRSLKNISDLSSSIFYQGQLIPGLFNPDPKKQGLIAFIDTKDVSKFHDESRGTSWSNPLEATYLVKKEIIPHLVKEARNNNQITNTALIAPYRPQVGLFREKLRNNLLFHEDLKKQVLIDFEEELADENTKGVIMAKKVEAVLNQLCITVDSIQGGQRKTIFVSFTRSNSDHEIGFNKYSERLCVTITRAQENLIMIGNSNTFLGCKYPEIVAAFTEMINFIKARGIYRKLKPQ